MNERRRSRQSCVVPCSCCRRQIPGASKRRTNFGKPLQMVLGKIMEIRFARKTKWGSRGNRRRARVKRSAMSLSSDVASAKTAKDSALAWFQNSRFKQAALSVNDPGHSWLLVWRCEASNLHASCSNFQATSFRVVSVILVFSVLYMSRLLAFSCITWRLHSVNFCLVRHNLTRRCSFSLSRNRRS